MSDNLHVLRPRMDKHFKFNLQPSRLTLRAIQQCGPIQAILLDCILSLFAIKISVQFVERFALLRAFKNLSNECFEIPQQD